MRFTMAWLAMAAMWASASVASAQAVRTDDFQRSYSAATAAISAFRSGGDPAALDDGILKLVSVVDPAFVTARNVRQREASLIIAWQDVFRLIDAELDSKWDPMREPYLVYTCFVPQGPGTEGLPSCATPSLIRNAASRQAYENQLSDNARRSAYNDRQQHIRQQEREAIIALPNQLELLSVKGGSASLSAEALISQSGINEDRKRQMTDMVRSIRRRNGLSSNARLTERSSDFAVKPTDLTARD